jgi:hypothetical protein
MVDSGKVVVNVTASGKQVPLELDVVVTPRDWAWSPVTPEQRSNPFTQPGSNAVLSVSNPPSSTPLGRMLLAIGYTYNTDPVTDNGPNHLLKYVTQITQSSGQLTHRYDWVMAQAADDPGSEFYMKQTGSYHAQNNPKGCIAGDKLRANIRRHESGSPLGHYGQYTAALQANNLGTLAESLVGSATTGIQQFTDDVGAMVESARISVTSATSAEPNPAGVNYNGSGVLEGYINFAPSYTSCAQ